MGFYIVRSSSGTEQVIVAVGSILWAKTELSTIIAANADATLEVPETWSKGFTGTGQVGLDVRFDGEFWLCKTPVKWENHGKPVKPCQVDR